MTQGIDALIGAPLIAEADDPKFTVDTAPLSGDLEFRDVVEFCLDCGTDGLVYPVNASEFYHLSTAERISAREGA